MSRSYRAFTEGQFEGIDFRSAYDERMGYFPLLYRLEGRERYLVWIGDEQDSVVVEPHGAIPTFSDTLLVRQYAERRQFTPETEEPKLHNLDWAESWCCDGGAPIDCAEALAAWNLFADVAASVGNAGIDFRAIDRPAPSTYQKLFWGNNLPAVTPEGEHYVPEWTAEDIQGLRSVLRVGLDLFKKCTFDWGVK